MKVPIISISINEGLKKFINKLVSKNPGLNKSKLIRDALLRLMSSPDYTNLDASTSEILGPITKTIIGNMMVVAPHEPNIQKKLNKIESKFQFQIVSKNLHFYSKNFTIFYVYEGSLQDLQKFVVEINSIKEIKNFRYLIIN